MRVGQWMMRSVGLAMAFVVIMGSILAPIETVFASTIPTTSNPVGNGIAGSRTMANPSFETVDSSCTVAIGNWAYLREDALNGWFSSHAPWQEICNASSFGVNTDRVIELNRITSVPDGDYYASLNADHASFLYQKLCFESGESFDFEFWHNHERVETHIMSFRLGIPSKSTPGTLPADTYEREIMRVSSTTSASSYVITNASITAQSSDTSAANSRIETLSPSSAWAVYSGTHTLPSTGYNGVRNVGFEGIFPTIGYGNDLDNITLGLIPMMDMGSTRDTRVSEQSQSTLRIRINGRVSGTTKIVLRKKAGTATSDADFALGTPTAGRYGNATMTHVNGSDKWVITVPPGDYDGGLFPSNRTGGLTIPFTPTYDLESEGDEYAWFELLDETTGATNGGTSNWSFSDPTCDGSFKSDGAVYTIRNINPTATPSLTPSITPSPTVTSSPTFTPTPHPFAVKDVAVGASFTLAVLNNGSLVTWGFNREGQASLPRWMAAKRVDQVEVGSNYAVALAVGGRVYGWGKDEFGQLRIPNAALSGVDTISAGLGHVMAIKSNGDLLVWGRNDFKQLDAPAAARRRISAVSAGHSHSLAVKSGTVIAWGRNTWGQASVPRNLTNVTAVAAGFDHSLALRSNGTVACWGRNNEGQCRLPAGMKDVIAVSAGVGYSLALTRDGVVYGWGRNNFGQASIPTGISRAGAIAAGYVNSVIGMRDANVIAFGDATLGALVSRTPTVTR